ncbi:MAG: ParB/RepB/Spo0J family partition protein [Halobacteriovoraceae bacterium]|nr:ParB/RepB/Spo0J family partition protein [Halobacteriovoraceae bacterium]
MTLESINLDSIKMENPYLRLGTDVSTLERSIENIGLMAPLVVNQKDILLAGARRWQALKNLGRTTVEVIRVDMDSLHEELISIDENLVRKDLNNTEMEQHLRRAKEIYRELAEKDETFKETLVQKRKLRMQEEAEANGMEEAEGINDECDVDTLATEEFAQEVSQKSGLSQRQIIRAIEREEKSSPILKEARERGEINVSQANEIIRLESNDQEDIIPHIQGRTVGELKRLVKDVKSMGVPAALEKNIQDPHAKEMAELLKMFKKTFKITEALNIEGLRLDGPMKSDLNRYWESIKDNMDELLDHQTQVFTPDYLSEQNDTTAESSFN